MKNVHYISFTAFRTRVLESAARKIASASGARKNRGALGVSGALQTLENNLQKYLK